MVTAGAAKGGSFFGSPCGAVWPAAPREAVAASLAVTRRMNGHSFFASPRGAMSAVLVPAPAGVRVTIGRVKGHSFFGSPPAKAGVAAVRSAAVVARTAAFLRLFMVFLLLIVGRGIGGSEEA
jgi:hypothetical protein